MGKGTYMIFMRGIPNYPTDQNSRMLMELLRNHYPWVIKNPKDRSLDLEHFDLSKDDEIQLMLLKHTKFSEIP